MPQFLLIIIIIMNMIAYKVMAADKKRSLKKVYRIPERTLLLLAFFGGAWGAGLAMYITRHKTAKPKFIILVPLFAAVQTWLLYLIIRWMC